MKKRGIRKSTNRRTHTENEEEIDDVVTKKNSKNGTKKHDVFKINDKNKTIMKYTDEDENEFDDDFFNPAREDNDDDVNFEDMNNFDKRKRKKIDSNSPDFDDNHLLSSRKGRERDTYENQNQNFEDAASGRNNSSGTDVLINNPGKFCILRGGCTSYYRGTGAIHTRKLDANSSILYKENKCRDVRKEVLREELRKIKQDIKDLEDNICDKKLFGKLTGSEWDDWNKEECSTKLNIHEVKSELDDIVYIPRVVPFCDPIISYPPDILLPRVKKLSSPVSFVPRTFRSFSNTTQYSRTQPKPHRATYKPSNSIQNTQIKNKESPPKFQISGPKIHARSHSPQVEVEVDLESPSKFQIFPPKFQISQTKIPTSPPKFPGVFKNVKNSENIKNTFSNNNNLSINTNCDDFHEDENRYDCNHNNKNVFIDDNKKKESGIYEVQDLSTDDESDIVGIKKSRVSPQLQLQHENPHNSKEFIFEKKNESDYNDCDTDDDIGENQNGGFHTNTIRHYRNGNRSNLMEVEVREYGKDFNGTDIMRDEKCHDYNNSDDIMYVDSHGNSDDIDNNDDTNDDSNISNSNHDDNYITNKNNSCNYYNTSKHNDLNDIDEETDDEVDIRKQQKKTKKLTSTNNNNSRINYLNNEERESTFKQKMKKVKTEKWEDNTELDGVSVDGSKQNNSDEIQVMDIVDDNGEDSEGRDGEGVDGREWEEEGGGEEETTSKFVDEEYFSDGNKNDDDSNFDPDNYNTESDNGHNNNNYNKNNYNKNNYNKNSNDDKYDNDNNIRYKNNKEFDNNDDYDDSGEETNTDESN